MNVVLKFVLLFTIFTLHLEQREYFAEAYIKLTNAICKSFDEKFAIFKSCRLYVYRRREISFTMHVRLFQTPVRNISVNLSLWRKANTFQPFLYNVTVDFCKFLKRRYSPPLRIVYEALFKTSNINHTCPFDHDIILDRFVPNDGMFRLLPLPGGQYMFKFLTDVNNERKTDVRVEISIDLDSKYN
ncbi:PREDICTED: uncharacterized protein LOC108364296 [Rhagoletis zephyria]|uniref:uncharacterized protein LOC108364296 n=1 Tax=Rhagoletis zephyria TaxID=28612 RepID=UPI00081198B8|nr:PREDICTED: uncharacterized protein LOC108364296 [Rhagoletis zephyria]